MDLVHISRYDVLKSDLTFVLTPPAQHLASARLMKAILALEDGTVFHGQAFGALGSRAQSLRLVVDKAIANSIEPR